VYLADDFILAHRGLVVLRIVILSLRGMMEALPDRAQRGCLVDSVTVVGCAGDA
jgi:hypothetical protein